MEYVPAADVLFEVFLLTHLPQNGFREDLFMRLVSESLKGYRRELVLGPVFKLLEAIIELLIPLVMADIIDIGIASGDMKYVISKAGLMLGMAIVASVFAMTCQYYAALAAGHFGQQLRGRLFEHVFQLTDAQTDFYGSGGLISALTNDSLQVQSGVNFAIRLGSRVPFLFFGSLIMALLLNWRIGLVFAGCAAIIALLLYLVMRSTLPQYEEIVHKQAELSRLAGESLDGARVIRAFSRRKTEEAEFDAKATALSRLLIRAGKISGALNPMTGFVVNIALVLVVYFGAGFALEGLIEVGQIAALVGYMNMTLLALVVAANTLIIMTRALASARRLEHLLAFEPEIVDGAGAAQRADAPAIEFREVSFAYHKGSENALAKIDFCLERGKTLGIIGGTGAGKSTLVGLLLRYFDSDSGRVLVNGADVRDYSLAELRGKIGLVPQRATLFSGTVRENIAVGNENALDEDIWSVLETAQAAEFVRDLPVGLDSLVEEDGKNFSGGQRQRLTIARALVRTPELLILDDSASALDYATDAALRRALKDHEKMTTVIISQRAASIMRADLILVMENGTLAGRGTHESLLESCEIYREICQSQGIFDPEKAQVRQ